jgi:hypothetical protein
MTNAERITELIQHKEKLDKLDVETNHMSGYNEWIVDVLELLLRIEHDRTKKPSR